MNYYEMYQLIFHEPYSPEKFRSGARKFRELARRDLYTLFDEGWIHPEEGGIDSPTMEEFCDFITIHPLIRAHGYVLDPDHENCRVIITGLEYHQTVIMEMLVDFVHKFKNADEFHTGVRVLWCDYQNRLLGEPIAAEQTTG